jgi:hypothetical protein
MCSLVQMTTKLRESCTSMSPDRPWSDLYFQLLKRHFIFEGIHFALKEDTRPHLNRPNIQTILKLPFDGVMTPDATRES